MPSMFEYQAFGSSGYFLHVNTSTLVESKSPLGALIDHEAGVPRPDLLSFNRSEVEKAIEQYEALTGFIPATIPDSGMSISQVAISPTLSCNLNCNYCYNYQEAEPERIRRLPSMLSTGLDKIFQTLSQLPLAKELTFGFLGGEPLLNLALIDAIVERSREFCTDRDIRPGFLVTTNGMNLGNPKIAEFITRNRVGVYISIDGPREWHNESRKTINGKGSYDLLIKSIESFFGYYPLRLRSARATVRLIPGRIIGTYRHLRDIGFNDIGWGSADFEVADLSKVETAKILDEIEQLGEEFVSDLRSGKVLRHSWFSEIFSLLYLGTSKQSICGATRNHVGFDVFGRMQPCHRYFGNEDLELSAGDIALGSESPLISEIRAGGKTPDCPTCWARGLCGGECFHVSRVVSRQSDHHERQRYTCNFKRKKYQVAVKAYLRLWAENPEIIVSIFENSYVGKSFKELSVSK